MAFYETVIVVLDPTALSSQLVWGSLERSWGMGPVETIEVGSDHAAGDFNDPGVGTGPQKALGPGIVPIDPILSAVA